MTCRCKNYDVGKGSNHFTYSKKQRELINCDFCKTKSKGDNYVVSKYFHGKQLLCL